MPEGTPIAVAFVEVRPEAENFQAQAEADLQAGIGQDALKVNANLELGGIPAARQQVDGLTADLARTLDQLAGATSPDFAQGFLAGAQEAVASAVELADASAAVNDELVTGTGVRQAFAAGNQRLAAIDLELAAAHRTEAAAAADATKAESALALGRSKQAQIGGLPIVARGTFATAAVVAAFQAQQQLTEALRVTGNEAGTTGGKLRNAFADLLSLDVVGAIGDLRNNTREFSQAELVAINNTEGLREALESLGHGANIAKSALAEVQGLTEVPQFLQTRIAQTAATGDTGGQLRALEQAQAELIDQEKIVRQLGLDQKQLNVALETIFRERKSIGDQIDSITSEARPDILAPLVEAVTDARLSGDANRIIGALQRERAVLERVIAAEKTSAADRRRFKDELAGVNRDIEQTQQELIDEINAHAEATRQGFLAPLATVALENEASGNVQGQIRSLQAEAAMVQAVVIALKATDTPLSNTYEEYLARLTSLNAEIEGLQRGIVSETERHARDSQQRTDDADQAFLASFERRTHQANMRKAVAAATAGLADDIAVSNLLQRIYTEEIAAARKRIKDKDLRDATIANLTEELANEAQSEKALRAQRRRDRVAQREESLDLDIELAAANDNTAAEIRAHQAKVRFLTERIKHTRANTNQRKQLRVEIARERAEIRSLKEEQAGANEDAHSFGEQAVKFLQELHGFSSNLASNVLPRGSGIGTTGNFVSPPSTGASTARPLPPPLPSGTPNDRVPSPFEHGRGRGSETTDPGAAAAAARASRGAPQTQSQGEELIFLAKQQVALLRDLKRGLAHPEAVTSRRLSTHKTATGVD